MLQAQDASPTELFWVKAHNGVVINKLVDLAALTQAILERITNRAQVVTPAGIKELFPSQQCTKQVKHWNHNRIQGPTYMVKDKGPLRVTEQNSPRKFADANAGNHRMQHILRNTSRWEMERGAQGGANKIMGNVARQSIICQRECSICH